VSRVKTRLRLPYTRGDSTRFGVCFPFGRATSRYAKFGFRSVSLITKKMHDEFEGSRICMEQDRWMNQHFHLHPIQNRSIVGFRVHLTAHLSGSHRGSVCCTIGMWCSEASVAIAGALALSAATGGKGLDAKVTRNTAGLSTWSSSTLDVPRRKVRT